MSKSITLYSVLAINISVNTDIKILSIREGIRDRDSGFRIIPDSIITHDKYNIIVLI